ncbi:type II toxin-antitoxin system RelE/ParE family toxin [Alkalinema pantanalense CENA528]|uniref:type II toxin-antitoxin system RelE/ParE family toxin n=1 Tax=Alkalinema pantanalense TaxID=1620705 RepID=UPI003D6E034E
MEATPWNVEVYTTSQGTQPFTEWLNSLKDTQGSNKILLRIRRIQMGNLGDHKFIADGVFELRMQFGPGYRVYFGKVENRVILLLCGGDKRSQESDIQKALKYWKDYTERGND